MLNGKYRGGTSGRARTCGDYRDARAGEMKRAISSRPRLHVALGRPLHDDGHRVDDGVDGRGAGHRAAGQRRDPRGRLAPQRARAHGGPAHRRDGARGPRAVEDPDRAGVRERDLVNGAIGGSTNAVVHLLAIAGRIGVQLTLDDWDRLGRDMPCLVDLMPSGQLPDGGLLLRRRLAGRHREIGERVAAQGRADRQRPHDLGERARTRQLERRGHHAVRQAVQAATAASRCCAAISRPTAPSSSRRRRRPSCCSTRAARWCSRTSRTCTRASTIRDLDIDADCVMVLKNCGPKGYPGMAEVGNLALPPKLLKQGVHRHGAHLRCAHVRDRVRNGRAARRRRRPPPADRWRWCRTAI